MARVFNTKEWGIGEWAAAIGIGWVVYQAVRDNERSRRLTGREVRDALEAERDRLQLERDREGV